MLSRGDGSSLKPLPAWALDGGQHSLSPGLSAPLWRRWETGEAPSPALGIDADFNRSQATGLLVIRIHASVFSDFQTDTLCARVVTQMKFPRKAADLLLVLPEILVDTVPLLPSPPRSTGCVWEPYF